MSESLAQLSAHNALEALKQRHDHPAASATTDLLIIAGEPSGDMHAAKFVRELLAKCPALKISAMGGEELAATGAKMLVDSKDLAVVGFIEVFKAWRPIRAAFKTLKKMILEQQPKIVVLVDYPGFNLRMAKFAKKHHCHVIYYISPQIWAWNQRRVHKIKRWVDLVAVIFPFEVDFFKRFDINARFVGHPLADRPLCSLTPQQAKQKVNLNPNHPVIALLPGSRPSELQALLPTFLRAAARLYAEDSTRQFILPKASTIDMDWLKAQLQLFPVPIKITKNQRYVSMQACDLAIAASGTVTLELALLEKPMIITYKTNPITFWLAKRLVKIKHIGLPNIVAGNPIVPELLQADFTAKNIVTEVNKLLLDQAHYDNTKTELAHIYQCLRSDTTQESLASLLGSSFGVAS